MSSKFSELINNETPTLVDSSAEWCLTSEMMKPILEDLKAKMGEKVTIIKIDVDKNPNVSSIYRIQGVPTLILFKNGEIKWRESGVQSAAQLEKIIGSYA